MGRYDFTRFTYLGYRRLFKRFDEIESGITGGPGTALAWSYRYFLLSFVTSRTLSKLVGGIARFTSFLDILTIIWPANRVRLMLPLATVLLAVSQYTPW